MIKIAITGKQCAGKTTVADLLLQNFGGSKIKFIDKLYQINNLLGVPKNRGFMQDLGESVRKYFGQDYFTKDFEKRAKQSKENLICDDLRKKVEFESAKKSGFIMVFIDSNEKNRKNRATLLGLDFIENHPAEQEISTLINKCNIIVENNGSIKELQEKVVEIFTPIFKNNY
jgi:dephospho-CoA kinase